MSNYHIYGQEDCTFCTEAAALLSEHNHDWVMEYVNDDAAHLRTILAQANLTSVPQIYSPTGEYIGGFAELQTHLSPSDDVEGVPV